MISRHVLFAAVAALSPLASAAAAASPPLNAPPPAGGRELVDMEDLGVARQMGQPIPTLVSLKFVATSDKTRFSFAMRADKSISFDSRGGEHIITQLLFLDNVNLERVDPKTHVVLTGNLVSNGDFEFGTGNDNLPDGWIFDHPDPFEGNTGGVTTLTPIDGGSPNHSFFSFSDDKYNALSQTIRTIPGATYDLGFEVAFTDNNPILDGTGIDTTDFQRLASTDTDGRQLPNGLDLVLTATNAGRGSHDDGHVHFTPAEGGVGAGGGPGGVPEPGTWAMTILGFACLGALARKRRGGLSRVP